ncbi:MAG: PAS domain S-box protein [Bizionia sp.]|nr:PAS domain S-box protein [Bizionia sp.]
MNTYIKILHLEDSPNLTDLVGLELNKGNLLFEKVVVSNKTDFKKALKSFCPDVVIANHNIPSFTAINATSTLHEYGLKTPVIIVTSTASNTDVIKIMKAGAYDFIFKDQLHRLAQTVLDVLDKSNKVKNDGKEKYHSLFKNSIDGILLTAINGDILDANPAACTIFEMTEEEICEAGIFGLVDNTDPRFTAALKERERTGKVKAEITLIRRNGIEFEGEITSVVYSNTNGEQRTSMIVRDISERKRTEKRLLDSATFNNGILSSLDAQIAVINQKGRIISVNKAWEDFAKENGGSMLSMANIGSNYFTLSKESIANGDHYTAKFLDGIQSVFKAEKSFFEMEFPSHALTKQQWFILRVKRFGNDPTKVVISRQNITDVKIAESNLSKTSVALQNTLSELNKILDSSLDVICTINRNGNFVSISAASLLAWGYEPEELIGTNFINLVHHDDIEITTQAAQNLSNGISVPSFENRYIHKTGKEVPLLWSVKWDEKLQLVFCIAKDVTEKKRLEKAIENERDQFYDMFLKAPSAIGMLKGENHIFEMANPFYLQSIGKNDIIGKTISEVLPEIVDQGVVNMLDYVYQTGESYSGKEILVKVDTEDNGELTDFYMDFVYQAYRNGKGDIEGVFFFINDITEQILSRKKIEKSEQQFRQIVETAQEGIWLIDENNKTTFVNKKICEILEYTEEELLGKEHFHYMDTDGKQKAITALEKRKKGKAESLEFSFISKSGKKVRTNISINSVFDDQGNFKGSLGMVSDITEKKHLEDLLEKSNRLAALGSWEIDVLKGTVYWSDITKEIREVDKGFSPTLDVGISYFSEGIHKETISKKVQECIENGTPWDEELQIITFKGNLKWVRTIGEGEFINGKCVKIHGSFQDIDKLKNAEIKIKESEFRYRQIVETAQEGIWMLDENSETTFVNQKMCEIIGYSAEEMMGKTNFYFKEKAGIQTAKNNFERRRQGISETYNASFMTKNGRLIWTQISSNPIFNDDNIYKGSLWMVSDITEKLKADKLLLDNEQKYRKLATQLDIERTRLVNAQAVAKVGSWETDLQTMEVNWSRETHRIFGSNPDIMEATHDGFVNFVHPDDKEKLNTIFEESLHQEGPYSLEHRIITLQGEEKWVEENWSVTKDKNGIPIRAVGTCQDITESKEAADKVIRSEAKLKLAQHIAQVGSYEVDVITREQTWSDEFYTILGITKETPPSREKFVQFIHPDDRTRALSEIDTALAVYENGSCLFRFVRTNGETGYASSEWEFEFNAQDNPIYIHGILRDLTTEKKAELERLKMISDIIQRNSDLEQFSYIVSHNLRAPTANIIGFTTILQDEVLTPKEQKQLLKGLSASVAGLDVIIKDINTILQSNRDVHEKKEVIEFSNLVEDIKVSIGHLIDKHQVVITTDFSEVEDIYSIKVYIYSIFYNLISNSIKYSKPNEQPIIEIKSKVENGKIILTFRDYGLGIDIKTKGDKLFGLYNRFHFHVEGKGMGLFMVKTQVESLGGKIEVASELNKGALFTITI